MSTYPYQYKTIDFGKICNPLVLLPVKTGQRWQNLWFLVDSGADTTTIPLSLGRQLGFSIDTSVKTKLFGIGDHSLRAFPGEIDVNFNGKKVNVRSYFVDSDESDLLLGRLDIFDTFTITFDRKKQVVIFA